MLFENLPTLSDIGLTRAEETLFIERSVFSRTKLDVVRTHLEKAQHVSYFDQMCIFTAGSYGRLEASTYSDVDLFFMIDGKRDEIDEFNIPQIRMLSDVIRIGDDLAFPKFSNDGEFLRILFSDDMEKSLGSRTDDFNNYFTARMLMLLESRSVFRQNTFDKIKTNTISAYFRDYDHHPNDFKPTFLINDILRFWKTLCLNYEHRRNQETERKKVKQKIKNFKLKYSRLLTCFAMVLALTTFKDTISHEEVSELSSMTPNERLRFVAGRFPETRHLVKTALVSYAWFLEKTGLPTEKLESYFAEKANREEAFFSAQKFGDAIFGILREIDRRNDNLRYLVV